MYHGDGFFFGVHMFWWLFWLVLAVIFFIFLVRVSDRQARKYWEPPLELLQHRYAAGELSTEEYQERKKRLQEDHR